MQYIFGVMMCARSANTRARGTNPEVLIAAAHAGCLTMALASQLESAGYNPTELKTEAAVSLDPEGSGFRMHGAMAIAFLASSRIARA
jgi:organic hydroperoxide reductase OsmC/OhrA